MRGTVAKRIRRAARQLKIDYRELKAKYLAIKRQPGPKTRHAQ